MTDFPSVTSDFGKKKMFGTMSSSNLLLIREHDSLKPNRPVLPLAVRHLNEESSVEIKVLRNALLPSQVFKT